MTRFFLAATLAWLAPSLAGAQALDPCATDLRSRPIGPLQVGELDGFLAVPHRACPREELALGVDALIVADADDFYGDIRVDGRGRISGFLLDPRVEAFVSWEAFRYQALLSAVSSSYVGLGYLAWGVSGQLDHEDGRVFALTGRMVLPTTTGLDRHAQPLAMDLGLTGAWQADVNFRFHICLTFLGSFAVSQGPTDPHAGLRFGGGVDWRPLPWGSLVLEIQSGFFYRDIIDMVAANVGLRFALGTEIGLEIAAQVPGQHLRRGAVAGRPLCEPMPVPGPDAAGPDRLGPRHGIDRLGRCQTGQPIGGPAGHELVQ